MHTVLQWVWTFRVCIQDVLPAILRLLSVFFSLFRTNAWILPWNSQQSFHYKSSLSHHSLSSSSILQYLQFHVTRNLHKEFRKSNRFLVTCRIYNKCLKCCTDLTTSIRCTIVVRLSTEAMYLPLNDVDKLIWSKNSSSLFRIWRL
jgi:hypothetical protein